MSADRPHVLVADDDYDIRAALGQYLNQHGFRVTAAGTGQEIDRCLATAKIDLLVLDIMMPTEDGLSILRRVQETARIPTVLLTALGEEIDRIVGLELGADDYVTKPFNPRELLARIKSVLRRSAMLPPRKQLQRGRVQFDRWRFDLACKELIAPDGLVVRLSSGEHLLLVTLIEHAGVALSRDQLLDLTKGRAAQLFDRSIDNVVSRLRRKIESDPKHPRIILTQWGDGYLFAADLEWA
jgi:two-component system OmpR family response regulator